jgi:hypothetical protein
MRTMTCDANNGRKLMEAPIADPGAVRTGSDETPLTADKPQQSPSSIPTIPTTSTNTQSVETNQTGSVALASISQSSGADPRFYVGGAFLPLMQGIANTDTQIPADVGYWLHPMGLDSARQVGVLPKVLSKFSQQVFAYEQDLNGWTDGSNLSQTNQPWVWSDVLQQNGGSGRRCGLAAPWVHSADIANPQQAIAKYKPLFDKMRSNGCTNLWVFWAPPSEPPIAQQALQGRTWNQIFTAVGATGAMVDHPAGRVDTLDVSFEFLKDARNAGLKVGWVFNGGDTAEETTAMMGQINQNLGALDVYAVDNFDSQNNGWPEVSLQLEAVAMHFHNIHLPTITDMFQTYG